MTHEEYCDLFGPPTPIVKYLIPLCRPLEDPTEDIPIFELEPGCVLDPLEEREQSPTGL